MEGVQEKTYPCEFCPRVFPCGKSLGGHKLCHLDLISATKNKESKSDQNSDQKVAIKKSRKVTTEGVEKLCLECGKVFGSIMAVNGHMKVHTKRSLLERRLSTMDNLMFHVVRKKRSVRREITANSFDASEVEGRPSD